VAYFVEEVDHTGSVGPVEEEIEEVAGSSEIALQF
jgi:hypothetical protein